MRKDITKGLSEDMLEAFNRLSKENQDRAIKLAGTTLPLRRELYSSEIRQAESEDMLESIITTINLIQMINKII